MIQKELKSMGMDPSYMNCVNANKKLMSEFFGDDELQYRYMPSYCQELKRKGHQAVCVASRKGVLKKMCVVYREGIEAFRQYSRKISTKNSVREN